MSAAIFSMETTLRYAIRHQVFEEISHDEYLIPLEKFEEKTPLSLNENETF